MPSTQNLAMLVQLREGTQPMAPRVAALLLRVFAVSIVPLNLWLTLFIRHLPVSLAAL